MSISRNLNPEKITIAEEKYKTGAGNMARKRSLSAINVATLEKLQQQDPAQGIEIYLSCAGSNTEVGNSFDGIIRKSRKQTERVLAYSLPALFEKRTRLISRLKRKSDNLNALMKSRLNGMVNQYGDLLKLFSDANYQYQSKLEVSEQLV